MRDLEVFTACLWDTAGAERETLTATREAVRAAHPGAGVVETCQRIEAFSLGRCTCPAPVRRSGKDAVEHLAAVAAGLESAVLGEYQVLGQVRSGIAPLRPRAPWLDAPVSAARQLRAEAEFATTTGYLLDAALAVAGFSGRGELLVVGAGAVARDVARRGTALGFGEIAVASRREPAPSIYGSRWIPLDQLPRAGRFDVAVGCLGATAGELARAQLPQVRLHVDLGSPRNFSSDVEPVVSLTQILATARTDQSDIAIRYQLRARLHALVAERLASHADNSSSPVGRIRREVEAVRAHEAARIARLHPELRSETIEVITQALVSRLMHAPSERLRQMDDPELAERVADLFANREPQA